MRLHRTLTTLLVAMALALPALVAAPSQTPGAGTLRAFERQFVVDAARGGRAEVELGRLASERGGSDAVRRFGQRMVTDHGRANDALTDLARDRGLTLPTDIDAGHRKLYDRLSTLSGAQFDRLYMDEMVKDHTKDVSDFRRATKRAKDAELKAWAGKTLPTLEDHLTQARSIDAQVKGGRRAAR